jgi:hypothetical protein
MFTESVIVGFSTTHAFTLMPSALEARDPEVKVVDASPDASVNATAGEMNSPSIGLSMANATGTLPTAWLPDAILVRTVATRVAVWSMPPVLMGTTVGLA